VELRGVVLAVVVLLAILAGLGIHLGSTGRQLLTEAERARRHSELEACAGEIGERVELLDRIVRQVVESESFLAIRQPLPLAEAFQSFDALLTQLASEPALLRLEILPRGKGPALAGYDRRGGARAPSLLVAALSPPEVVVRARSLPPRQLLLGVRDGESAHLVAAWATGHGPVVFAELELGDAFEHTARAVGEGRWALAAGERALWPLKGALPYVPPAGSTGSSTHVEGDDVVSVTQVRGGSTSGAWRLLVRTPLTRGFTLATQAALALAALIALLGVGLGIYGARAASLGESLRHSERQERELQGTFDAITDPLLVLDAEFRVVRVNRSASEATAGLTYAEVLERRGLDDPQAELAALRQVVAEGKPRVAEVLAGERVLEVAQFPVFGGDLNVAGIVEHARDVTDTKALRSQLVQSEKLSTLGEMAAGIAHEINNPIGVIVMFSQLLSEELRDKDDLQGALRKVTTIEEQAANVGDIVKGLLRFARKSEGSKVRFDANSAVERALSIVGHQKMLRTVTLERTSSGAAFVVGDEGQLAQVVLNLVVNGCHAMKGEGTLKIDVRRSGAGDDPPPGRAFGPAPETEDRVRLSFSDSGAGIPPEKLEKIFEPFFTTKPAGEGTGLGLSVGFAIIRDHAGCIWVHTREGEGTTFTLDLPAAPAEGSA
jgi:signal transduction histidine kinase